MRNTLISFLLCTPILCLSQTTVLVEDFDNYTSGNTVTSESAGLWQTWSGGVGTYEEAYVSSTFASSGANSLKITETGQPYPFDYPNDVVLPFPSPYLNGEVEINLKIYVPTNYAGLFVVGGIWDTDTNFENGVSVYFNMDGSGRYSSPLTSNGFFTYTKDAWNDVSIVIDVDNKTYELVVNGVNYGSGGMYLPSGFIGAMNFYGDGYEDNLIFPQNSATSNYYIDDIEVIATGQSPWPLTYVPDDNFEAYLEANGLGNGTPNDDSVYTVYISSVSSLDISSLNITDLTGLEDFNSLTNLDCSNNPIASIDLSQNTELELLTCHQMQLTTLDLSQNPSLYWLNCNNNSLSVLDVSFTPLLSLLNCSNNQITSLDLSNHDDLVDFWCEDMNVLTCLNVKNGSNQNFSNFHALNNPNVDCIEVDDVTYSTNNWTNYIDAGTSFSTNCNNNCSTIHLGGFSLIDNRGELSVYPNPSFEGFTIDLGQTFPTASITVTDLSGKLVYITTVVEKQQLTIHLNEPPGVYLLTVETDDVKTLLRLVIQ